MIVRRLTIAIPTVNRVDLLKRSLESALAQTSDEIEILVSDNGSTDATPQLLAGFHDPRLRVVRREVTVPRAQHGSLIFAEINTEFVLVLPLVVEREVESSWVGQNGTNLTRSAYFGAGA